MWVGRWKMSKTFYSAPITAMLYFSNNLANSGIQILKKIIINGANSEDGLIESSHLQPRGGWKLFHPAECIIRGGETLGKGAGARVVLPCGLKVYSPFSLPLSPAEPQRKSPIG